MQEPEWFATAIKLESIFMPSARKRRDDFYKGASEAKFVHYTTAEAALNIIRSKSLWMRNAKCMSDFKEIQHGREMLQKHFVNTKIKDEFRALIDSCVPDVTDQMFILFDNWWIDTEFNTYIASISEHDEMENEHGRLSMWRAFGGNSARVAIVFNIPWIPKSSLNLNIEFSPVIYHDEKRICDELQQIMRNIDTNREFIKAVSPEEIKGSIFNMLMALVLSFKHEGFHEEREWRAIYKPQQKPSHLMKSDVQVVNGIPQIVYKLPLNSSETNELEDLDFANLFDRLIIGPTQYPSAIADAFNEELTKIGVKDAGKKISISGIPIRT